MGHADNRHEWNGDPQKYRDGNNYCRYPSRNDNYIKRDRHYNGRGDYNRNDYYQGERGGFYGDRDYRDRDFRTVLREETIVIIQTIIIMMDLIITVEIGKIMVRIATCVNVETTDTVETDTIEMMIDVQEMTAMVTIEGKAMLMKVVTAEILPETDFQSPLHLVEMSILTITKMNLEDILYMHHTQILLMKIIIDLIIQKMLIAHQMILKHHSIIAMVQIDHTAHQ